MSNIRQTRMFDMGHTSMSEMRQTSMSEIRQTCRCTPTRRVGIKFNRLRRLNNGWVAKRGFYFQSLFGGLKIMPRRPKGPARLERSTDRRDKNGTEDKKPVGPSL